MHFLLAAAKISNPFAHIANCSKFTFPCETTEQAQYVCLDYITPGFLKFKLSPQAQSPSLVDFLVVPLQGLGFLQWAKGVCIQYVGGKKQRRIRKLME